MIEKLYSEPDIFRIFVPLPDSPLKNLNCYVICSNEEYLIIDTGFNRPECKEAFFAGLDELGVDSKKTRLFLTHLHGDHTGLAGYLTEKGVETYMNAIDYDHFSNNLLSDFWPRMERLFVEEGYPPEEIEKQLSSNHARKFVAHYRFPVTEINHNDLLTVGDVKLRCIHTPGHTPGHTCLYLENEKILFSGDHILFDITPNISVWVNVPASLEDYLNSLKEIRNLDVTLTYPGHREFQGNLKDRIDMLITHHHERLNEIQNAIATHPNETAYHIAGYITWSARGKAWEEFSPNQRWFAMGETLAHIKYLLDHNRIHRTKDGTYTL